MGLVIAGLTPVARHEGAGQQAVAAEEIGRKHDIGIGLQDLVAGCRAEARVEGIGQDPARLAVDPQDADARVGDARRGDVIGHRHVGGPVDDHHFGDLGIGQPGGQGAQKVLRAVHRTGDKRDAGPAFGAQGRQVLVDGLEGGRRGGALGGLGAALGQGGVQPGAGLGRQVQADEPCIAVEDFGQAWVFLGLDRIAHRQHPIDRRALVPRGLRVGQAQIQAEKLGIEVNGAVVSGHRIPVVTSKGPKAGPGRSGPAGSHDH